MLHDVGTYLVWCGWILRILLIIWTKNVCPISISYWPIPVSWLQAFCPDMIIMIETINFSETLESTVFGVKRYSLRFAAFLSTQWNTLFNKKVWFVLIKVKPVCLCHFCATTNGASFSLKVPQSGVLQAPHLFPILSRPWTGSKLQSLRSTWLRWAPARRPRPRRFCGQGLVVTLDWWLQCGSDDACSCSTVWLLKQRHCANAHRTACGKSCRPCIFEQLVSPSRKTIGLHQTFERLIWHIQWPQVFWMFLVSSVGCTRCW